MKRIILVIAVVLLLVPMGFAQNTGGLFRLTSGYFRTLVPGYLRIVTPANDTFLVSSFVDLSTFDSLRTARLIVGGQAFPVSLGTSGQVLKSDGSSVVWSTDNEGSGPISSTPASGKDSVYAFSEQSGLTDSIQFMFVSRLLTNKDGVTTRRGTRLRTFNHTLDLSDNLVWADTIWYEHLMPSINAGDPVDLVVDDITAKQSSLDLAAVTGSPMRFGLNVNNPFQWYYGASLNMSLTDSTLDGQGSLVMTDLRQIGISGTTGQGIVSVSGGVSASGYYILGADSIADWKEVVPYISDTASLALDIDTTQTNWRTTTWIGAIIAALQSDINNPDSVFGNTWVIPTWSDSDFVWFDSTGPGTGRFLRISISSLRSIIGSDAGLLDTTNTNPDSAFWNNGTKVPFTIVTDNDTTIIGAGANGHMRLGVAAGVTTIRNHLSVDTIDVKDDAGITFLTPNVLPDSAINYPAYYIPLNVVLGLGYTQEDSARLTQYHAAGVAVLFRDSSVAANTDDTVGVMGTSPWPCLGDSLVVVYRVVDADIDSMNLYGPDRSSAVNVCDSSYAAYTTGLNATSWTRVAIDLAEFSIQAGDNFMLRFFNGMDAADDKVEVAWCAIKVLR